MTLSDLSPGMAVRGPSGTVYRVLRCDGRRAVLESEYPWDNTAARGMNPLTARIEVDWAALERFQRAAAEGEGG